MDSSEEIVKALLQQMGFNSIVYEPDGNIPPDFLADGRVAIEVRRLNQNHVEGNSKRGLEEISIPLWQKIEKLGHSLGPPNGESWLLFFRFSRPLKPWKELAPKIEAALKSFKSQPTRHGGRVFTDGEFELDVIKSSHPLETFFCMGGSNDRQSGGFIVAEMLANIAHCAAEKQAKIQRFKGKYSEWWLVLTDHIGLGLNERDRQQLLKHAMRPDDWDKIVIVSPSDPSKWFYF